MKIEIGATLLSAESKPYEIEGNKGVSHKARFLIEGEIFKVNATEADIVMLRSRKEEEDVTGELTIDIMSPKENVKIQFVSFQ